ncbi:hypothetical protein [Shewanella maritima]|uniref:hypothetical protein n=1 Tax=Shewanella maritima TaxID=2520507 RepID=UPI003736C3B9
MKAVLSIIAAIIISGCASTIEEEHEIPKRSIGSAGKALGQDIINSIDTYVLNNFHCKSWKANSVEHVSVMGELYFKKSGHIVSGSVAENWNIVQCGTDIKLALVITADGAGGNLVAIKKL